MVSHIYSKEAAITFPKFASEYLPYLQAKYYLLQLNWCVFCEKNQIVANTETLTQKKTLHAPEDAIPTFFLEIDVLVTRDEYLYDESSKLLIGSHESRQKIVRILSINSCSRY